MVSAEAESTAGDKQHPPIKRGATVEELARRMVSIDGSDDDIARILANNWQNVLWALVLGAVVIVVFREFQATRQKKAGEIALRFSEVQGDYQKASEAKVNFEPPPALVENLKLLSTSYSDDIYGKFAKLYQAKLSTKMKKFDEAYEALRIFPVASLLSTQKAKSIKEVEINDLVVELAALETLRIALAEGKQQLPEIRRQLTGLAYGSRFVTVEALVALNRLADTQAEKDAVGKAANDVIQAREPMRGFYLKELSAENVNVPGAEAPSDAGSLETGGEVTLVPGGE